MFFDKSWGQKPHSVRRISSGRNMGIASHQRFHSFIFKRTKRRGDWLIESKWGEGCGGGWFGENAGVVVLIFWDEKSLSALELARGSKEEVGLRGVESGGGGCKEEDGRGGARGCLERPRIKGGRQGVFVSVVCVNSVVVCVLTVHHQPANRDKIVRSEAFEALSLPRYFSICSLQRTISR